MESPPTESRLPASQCIEIVEADLDRAEHQRAVVELLDAYAADPIIDGKPLAAEVRRELIAGLRCHPTTLIFLAFDAARAVGVAVCFRGFSTFYARPLINIHDLAVVAEYRGQGIGRRLLEAVAARAGETGCCKLTLEVRENNHRARRMYEAAGFTPGTNETGGSGFLFLAKPLL
jgi:ribosomal protein S18 acetylase RimI-like enzyme